MAKIATKMLALAGAAGILSCLDARADVIYTFTTTSYSFNTTSYSEVPGLYITPSQGLPLTATLDLTDAQVQSGSFVVSSDHGGPTSSSLVGDVSGFNSVAFGFPSLYPNSPNGVIQDNTATSDFLNGPINASFTFDALGRVTSSDLNFGGVAEDVRLSGTGNNASGTVGSDLGNCNVGGYCSVSGFWSVSADTLGIFPVTLPVDDPPASDPPASDPPGTVPEPASLGVFGAALLVLTAVRRRLRS